MQESREEDGIRNEAWKNSVENITETFNKICGAEFPKAGSWDLYIPCIRKEKELILGITDG